MPEEEDLNLSADPSKIVLDPNKNYTSKEMKKILMERANAVYKA